MENVKKKNNKVVLIALCVVVLLLIVIVFVATSGSRLENSFKRAGKHFYTQYYYKNTFDDKSKNEISSSLSRYKDIGIRVSLAAIENYDSNANQKIINKLKSKKCDDQKTYVTIYPKEPYGKNDFKIEASLSCK